jgi:putative ABC transport system substrate-binding protein
MMAVPHVSTSSPVPASCVVGRRMMLLCLAGVVILTGCLKPVAPVRVRAAAPEAASIVVLRSTENPLFDAPVSSFIESVEGTVNVFVVESEAPGRLQGAIAALKPDLVLALGASAAVFARDQLRDYRVLFAMVLNYAALNLDAHPRMTGISLEPPPQIELFNYKMIVPHLRKVLCAYSPAVSDAAIENARSAATALGIELVAVPVTDLASLRQEYDRRLPEVDAVWVINDPLAMSEEAFWHVVQAARQAKRPLLCSLSEQFARAGALASVAVDFTAIGAQAAAMTRDVLERKQPMSEFAVQPPIGSKLVVNVDTARTIGLTIPEEVYSLINQMIGDR